MPKITVHMVKRAITKRAVLKEITYYVSASGEYIFDIISLPIGHIIIIV